MHVSVVPINTSIRSLQSLGKLPENLKRNKSKLGGTWGVIMQLRGDALRVNSTLTHLSASHPFLLLSADKFKAHASWVDQCGVRSINNSGVRLNRPHMSSKHIHPEIHRWARAGLACVQQQEV